MNYLKFNNNCNEALEFYKYCFDGEVESIYTYSINPSFLSNMPKEYLDKVWHSKFTSKIINFYAYDEDENILVYKQYSIEGIDFLKFRQTVSSSPFNFVEIGIDNFQTEDEQKVIFNRLSEKGTVLIDLYHTFFGSILGKVVDKYGVVWLLNYYKK